MESKVATIIATRALGPENVFVTFNHRPLKSKGEQTAEYRWLESLEIPKNNILTLPNPRSAEAEFILSHIEEIHKNLKLQDKLIKHNPSWKEFFQKNTLWIQSVNKTELSTGSFSPLSRAGTLGLIADLYHSDVLEPAQSFGLNTGEKAQLAFDDLLKEIVKGALTRDELKNKHQALGLATIESTLNKYYASEPERQISSGVVLRVTNSPLSREAQKIINGVRGGYVPSADQIFGSCLKFYSE